MLKLAELTGMHVSTIQRIETGKIPLCEEGIRKLCAALDVDICQLLDMRCTEPGRPAPVSQMLERAEAIDLKHKYDNGSATELTVTMPVNTLDNLNIFAGDQLKFRLGNTALSALETGDVVLATPRDTPSRAIVRQYIDPGLLITNSLLKNLISLHTMKDEMDIIGVLYSIERKLKSLK